MFNKIALVAAVLPLVNALTWGPPPTDAVSTQSSTLTWTHTDDDVAFTIELNHPSLLERIAIANNVNPGDDSITVTWPVLLVHDGQYTVEAVNVGNISDIYATSSAFNIAAPPSQSLSSTSSGSAATSGTASVTVTTTGASTTGTSPATSRSSTGSNTASNSASTSAAPSAINGGDNGAMSVKVNGGLVALAAAGAALFAL